MDIDGQKSQDKQTGRMPPWGGRRVFNGLRDEGWEIKPTLSYALEEMELVFSRSFTSEQVSEFFKTKTSRRDMALALPVHYGGAKRDRGVVADT